MYMLMEIILENNMKGKPILTNVRIEIVKSGFTAMDMVDEKENKTEKAVVLEIGDDVTLVKVGDTILFKDYNLDELLIDNEKYSIIPQEDIKYVWNTFTTTEK